jgi:Uma2 family endonuclease
MSAISTPSGLVAIADYFEREHQSSDRHEFLDGRVVAMAGGTYRHSVICLNVGAELRAKLKGKPCVTSESNTRVAVASRRAYVYPDLTVICGTPMFDPLDKRQTTLVNPTLLVEVLSEGTENYDRGEKFSLYRSVESLREYVIVETASPRVETFFRHEDGSWQFAAFELLTGVVRLRSLGIELPMAGIYERIDFAPAESSTPPDPE